MILKINTFHKTIEVSGIAKLTEFFEELNKRFPNDEWKEYSLDQKSETSDYSIHTFGHRGIGFIDTKD